MKKNVKYRIFIWGNIIVPIIVAIITCVITVRGNDYFHRRQINTQLSPLLVSISAIVKNNEQIQPVTIIYAAPVLRTVIYVDINKKPISEEVITRHNKGDTVTIKVPCFLLNKQMKNKLTDNLNLLTQNRYIDEQLYFILSDIDDFLMQYPFPKVSSTYELASTRWAESEIVDKWNAHVTKLHKWYMLKSKL
jgi:hypothetical protein